MIMLLILKISGPNQVDTFLQENGGPGVQHIGLSTSDIFMSVEDWTARHVSFISPPKNYYDEVTVKLFS